MPKSAKLGQNFLRDEGFARRIVDLVEAAPGPLLEIGAGKGILSRLLLKKFLDRRLVLVEVDPTLVAELEHCFNGPEDPRRGGRAEILAGDILQVDLALLFPGEKASVVGNLPYHISKHLVDWLITQRQGVGEAVLMLQKDYIDKLLATAGGKKYNAQSVVCQLLFQARRCFDVPAGAFAPAPKVVSTVIVARPLEPPLPDVEGLYDFVKKCFSERRKTLRNNLAPHYGKAVLTAAFAAAGISAQTRAEQLPADHFITLLDTMKNIGMEHGP